MNNIWLIGSGKMAQDYIKVLRAIGVDFIVIGRGVESAKKCEEISSCKVVIGGITQFLSKKPKPCTHAIVCVGVESLTDITLELIQYGVNKILVEKPGGLNISQVESLARNSQEKKAQIVIGYNRRFYGSVIKAREIISRDGGMLSFNFEFTEWAHIVKNVKKPEQVLERWFLANSTHVVDLAFYLGGEPKELCAFTSGALDWHPAASMFSGAGVSVGGSLFSYQANWESAGRWAIELLTKNYRLILRPIEKLQIQKKGSLDVESIEFDQRLDELFKPGLFLQTNFFLNEGNSGLCDVFEQLRMMQVYQKISGYEVDF